jgi:hypothetical protein
MYFSQTLLFFSLFFASLHANPFSSKMIIHNTTDAPIFFAMYYQRDYPAFKAKQIIAPLEIKPGKTLKIKRPEMKLLYSRMGIVAFNQELLKPSLTHREYKNLERFLMGITTGDVFYIKKNGNQLQSDNIFEKATEPMKKVLNKILDDDEKPIIESDIKVRVGNKLCLQEQTFIRKRLPKVKEAFEKILGPKDGYNIPTVIAMGSGGGYRALIGFWGAIQGLHEIGVWDTCMYASGVSGSTWILSALYGAEQSMDTLTDYLKPRLAKNLLKKHIYELDELASIFFQKDDFTLIDVWGLLLSRALFGEHESLGDDVTLSSLTKQVDNGQMPLPIMTAVQRGMDKIKWFEYTPYEVGSQDYQTFIPARYAGARFINGVCQEPKFKEYPLGLHCGVFGSAFAVDGKRVSDSIDNKFLDLLLLKTRLRGYQATTGSLVNYMKDMTSTPISKSKILKMVDAGEDLNIPMPPCMRRKPDILIIVDLAPNEPIYSAKVLEKALQDARDRGYIVPDTDPEIIRQRNAVTVIRASNNPQAPIIIFIPNLYQSFETLKPLYTPEEFDSLAEPMRKAVVDNKQLFYDVCAEVFDRKNPPKTIANPEIKDDSKKEVNPEIKIEPKKPAEQAVVIDPTLKPEESEIKISEKITTAQKSVIPLKKTRRQSI